MNAIDFMAFARAQLFKNTAFAVHLHHLAVLVKHQRSRIFTCVL